MDLIYIAALDDKRNVLIEAHPFYKIDIKGTNWNDINLKVFKAEFLFTVDQYLKEISLYLDECKTPANRIKLIETLLNDNEFIKGFLYGMFLPIIGLDFLDIDSLNEHYTVDDKFQYFDKKGNLISHNNFEVLTRRYAKQNYKEIITEINYCLNLFNDAIITLKDNEAIEAPGVKIIPNNELSNLTAFELALMHWYLVEAKIEIYIKPNQVGLKYGGNRNPKNIEQNYSKIDTKPQKRIPKPKELENVKNALFKHPIAQKLIINDMDN